MPTQPPATSAPSPAVPAPLPADLSRVTSLVLGGGRGTRLYPLTRYRSKPAVPLAAKYRLIDVPISNCIHSGLRRIYVITQFNSASLNRHVAATYKFDAFSSGFVEILAAEQTADSEQWFQGTADAVRRNLHHFADPQTTHVLILAGDALYRQDYRQVFAQHLADDADITCCCKLVSATEAPAFGIVSIDPARRITAFHEKPRPENLPGLEADPEVLAATGFAAAQSRPYLASMGIYLFKKEVLLKCLADESAEDFGKQVLPRALSRYQVSANLFDGYWEDIGTIRAFYQANLDLLSDRPHFSFYEPGCPIYTHHRLLPASEVSHSQLDRAMIAEGSRVRGATITNSILGIRSIVAEGAHLHDTIMMGADYYEADLPAAAVAACQGQPAQAGCPPIGIGEGSHIEAAIIDKNARIGKGVRIERKAANTGDVDADNYSIKDGIVLIPKGAVLADGTVI